MFVPKPLGTSVDARVMNLARVAAQEPLVIYAGAGLSVEEPAAGPKGRDVADGLLSRAAILARVNSAELADLSLEGVADVVETTGQLAELREYAVKRFSFIDMPPNYGHIALAQLCTEGATRVFSVNWDCAIENACTQLRIPSASITSRPDLIANRTGKVPVFKLHGCATKPATLHMTTAEVDRPQTWAVDLVRAELTMSQVVFVGLGTVGNYVADPLRRISEDWLDSGVTVVVVDPGDLSQDWIEVLGENAESIHLQMSGSDFLDQLLRATVAYSIESAEAVIGQHEAEDIEWCKPFRAGFDAFKAAIECHPPSHFVTWIRDGMASSQTGKGFLATSGGIDILLALSTSIKDPSNLKIHRFGQQLVVSSEGEAYEVAVRPGSTVQETMRAAKARAQDKHLGGAYSPDVDSIKIVAHGFSGQIPPRGMLFDIASQEAGASDISSGMEAVSFEIVKSEIVTSK